MVKLDPIDGLPVDLYKYPWPVTGEELLAVLSDSLSRKCLPQSYRKAVVTLMLKGGSAIIFVGTCSANKLETSVTVMIRL